MTEQKYDIEIVKGLIKTINYYMEGRIKLLKRIPEKDLTEKEKQDLIIDDMKDLFD